MPLGIRTELVGGGEEQARHVTDLKREVQARHAKKGPAKISPWRSKGKGCPPRAPG